MKKTTITTVMLCFLCFAAVQLFGQDSLSYRLAYIAIVRNGNEVGVGGKVPDIMMPKILNAAFTSNSLSRLNDKPVILEFWHQYCSVCRGEIPKLNALYERYKDSVQFLMVTFQSSASVQTFIQEQAAAGKPLLLPVVVEDTLLRKTFGHDGDPQVVWIGKGGVVQAITSHLALTEAHVKQWLKDGDIHLSLKSSARYFSPDARQLIPDAEEWREGGTIRSAVSRYIDSIPQYEFYISHSGDNTKLLISNTTLDDMLKACYIRYDTLNAAWLDMDWKNKRICYETKDSSRVSYWDKAYDAGYDAMDHFQRQHLYCYELEAAGDKTDREMAAYALKDLQRLLHVSAFIDTRQTDGLALVQISKDAKFTTKGVSDSSKKPAQDSIIAYNNTTMLSLVNVLNINYDFPLVQDETDYHVKIDFRIPFVKDNLELVRKSLKNYGLDLVSRQLHLPMLVLRDE